MDNETARANFLRELPQFIEQRFDRIADSYDSIYGECGVQHLSSVATIAEFVEGGELLDAACGTGKYWELLEGSGATVTGFDISPNMLKMAAAAQHSNPTKQGRVERLGSESGWEGKFSGVICVDAMEWIAPERWPEVLRGFRYVTKPGSKIYISRELPDFDEMLRLLEPAKSPLIEGELAEADLYSHFATHNQVEQWLANAKFRIDSAQEGDGYEHLIATRI